MPEGVTQVLVSGCAAGGQGSPTGKYDDQAGGKAGQYIFRLPMKVEPKQQVSLTIGMGNTIVGDLILLANYTNDSFENEFLGYKTGLCGNDGESFGNGTARGGAGGAFGYGGSGGGASSSSVIGTLKGENGTLYYGGGGYNGGYGGCKGGIKVGITTSPEICTYENAGYMKYDSGKGKSSPGAGGGGGGYGAGGGGNAYSGNVSPDARQSSQGSPGIVIIEW